MSHVLCPYVQRVAIVLHEKGVAFARRDINLADKPEWFLARSPTGKTPLLLIGSTPIFESSVICEYLDEVYEPRLHPACPLERAGRRAWMEFASGMLGAIAALYSASTDSALVEKTSALRRLLERLETALGDGPYFAGETFSMVDAAFAPALRYFDVIENEGRFGFFKSLPRLCDWRHQLAGRRSVQEAAVTDYVDRVRTFLLARDNAFSRRLHEALNTPTH